MKEQLLYDIFLGFLLMSIWLNVINGYLQSLINNLSDNFKLSLCSFAIIFVPLLADFVFNGSDKDSKTFVASALSAVVALAVRESFVWWKDRNEIKEEIFSELYGNYRSLESFVKVYQVLKNMPDVNVSFEPTWNKSIEFKWIDRAFNNHFEKLQPKKIFSQQIIDDLRDTYESMRTAINEVNNSEPTFSDSNFMSNIFLGDKNLGVLNQIKNLLININKKKANELNISNE